MTSDAETGDDRVTSHMSDGECRQLQCLNGGVCILNDQQLETCQYVLPCTWSWYRVICRPTHCAFPADRRAAIRVERWTSDREVAGSTPARALLVQQP